MSDDFKVKGSREQLGLAKGQLAAEARALSQRLGIGGVYILVYDREKSAATSGGYGLDPGDVRDILNGWHAEFAAMEKSS